MDNQQKNGFISDKFTWTIKNFSKLNSKKLYSETFNIGGCPWRILIYPNGNNVDHLSIYLDAADAASLPYGWSRFASFGLAVINQANTKMTVTKVTQHYFNGRESDWGFTSFMASSKLRDPGKGFLVKDTCIISAEVSVLKSGNENQEDQAAGIIASPKPLGQAPQMEMETSQQEDKGPFPPLSAQVCTEHTDNPSLTKEMYSTSIDELVDFRGMGQIEKTFVSLLEEVCSQHPSLIECQRNRSRRFIEWAFTALGRVLHFLKAKKAKDMNEDACKDLQILWEELETFRFDLTWLEPHVQSALGMKNYMERAMQVKRLKENVGALEMDVKGMKAKLAATEVDLEIARRDLVQAEEGFEERDMDAELGYGRP